MDILTKYQFMSQDRIKSFHDTTTVLSLYRSISFGSVNSPAMSCLQVSLEMALQMLAFAGSLGYISRWINIRGALCAAVLNMLLVLTEYLSGPQVWKAFTAETVSIAKPSEGQVSEKAVKVEVQGGQRMRKRRRRRR